MAVAKITSFGRKCGHIFFLSYMLENYFFAIPKPEYRNCNKQSDLAPIKIAHFLVLNSE